MPNVNGKKFPYTKEGMKKAEAARKRKKSRKRNSSRKDMNGNTYE